MDVRTNGRPDGAHARRGEHRPAARRPPPADTHARRAIDTLVRYTGDRCAPCAIIGAMKQRTSITWEPENYTGLKRYCAASGETMTQFVNELVSAVLPELLHAVDLADQFKNAKADVKKRFTENVDTASSVVMPQVQAAYRSYQEMMANLDEVAEVSAGGKEPPYSNTGVIKL